MKRNTPKLPTEEALQLYLKELSTQLSWSTVGGYNTVIRIFLRWMGKQKLSLQDLDAKVMDRFTKSISQQGNCIETRWRARALLFQYFEWLHSNDYPIRDPNELLPYKKPRSDLIDVTLPKDAIDFLDLVKTTNRSNTWSSYQTSLRHFYKYLIDSKIEIKKITRRETEDFLKCLLSKNQAPSTRLTTTLVVRKYLRWLKEHKKLRLDPDALIKSSDYPKIPKYLPRPIPPDIDRLIQTRFAESTELLHKGLLLMRWTGIRVGELSNLPRDCVKIDFNGNAFLKVPLGKLNTERMVPLSPRVLKLIEAIKKQVDDSIKIKDPQFLLLSAQGKQVPTHNLMYAFKELVMDLKSKEPLVTHRLRHTYATELLTAGMNIFALRDVLGHKDIRMTLLYAEVTQEKVRYEYFAALDRLENEQNYQQEVLSKIIPKETTYIQMLHELSLEIKQKIRSKKLPHSTFTHLNKRIRRLHEEIETVLK